MTTFSHIDTCQSCYLTDHHNRPGEMLLGVVVDGQTRWGDVAEALRDEYRANAFEEMPADEDFNAALRKIVPDVWSGRGEPQPDYRKLFDASLDAGHDDDDAGEPVQAWFLLQWEVSAED